MLPQVAREMSPAKDLIALHVPEDETVDYRVPEAGWYAVDDGGHVVLGPYSSLAECDRAIQERSKPPL